MDEYLFLTMAKLKADRLKLEREQRAQAEAQRPESRPPQRESPNQTEHELIPLLTWR
jgi:hypothetical protein